ncbi:L-idonate 5-dehydrogenase [uncultured Roseibium sp.]|uniref:L-idonate 5-dehydrogenase n=1 Tax=uncultured Roseibium sp. TaxID=1936171 RepID=UPI002626180F|nr:L-idonate 5-dehydrogenase [uncultured Roseibium sp.]
MTSRACVLHGIHDLRLETQSEPVTGPGDVKIAILAGGICGSDLHYFDHGGFGPVRVREPIAMGHEAAGRVVETGIDVDAVHTGDLVAINPSQPCGHCLYCKEGNDVHCLDMRFMGSAYRLPHEQGLFRERIVVPAKQVHRFGQDIRPRAAACAEPLAVCLHARAQAPDLKGKRVLVTGAGPIGALCVAVAREAGATEIVATDLQAMPLSVAKQMGASKTVNLAAECDGLDPYKTDKGQFDVAFECSAAASAIRDALLCLRPRGTFIAVGVAGDTPVPLNLIVSKEITVRGTHRFHAEFAASVTAINSGSIDVAPIISPSFPLEKAVDAFTQAGDRTHAMKVHILFNGYRAD